jgi:hypothetical protein
MHSRADDASMDGEEAAEPFVTTAYDNLDGVDPSDVFLPTVDPQSLIGSILRMEHLGSKYRARVDIMDDDVNFLLKLGDGEREELMNYHDLMQIIYREMSEDEENDGDPMWTFSSIADHRKKRSGRWEILVNWGYVEQTWEELHLLAKDDPITCAKYAEENNSLEIPGWQRFKRLVKTDKSVGRTNGLKFKFGAQVPKNYTHAVKLDEENGNTP